MQWIHGVRQSLQLDQRVPVASIRCWMVVVANKRRGLALPIDEPNTSMDRRAPSHQVPAGVCESFRISPSIDA